MTRPLGYSQGAMHRAGRRCGCLRRFRGRQDGRYDGRYDGRHIGDGGGSDGRRRIAITSAPCRRARGLAALYTGGAFIHRRRPLVAPGPTVCGAAIRRRRLRTRQHYTGEQHYFLPRHLDARSARRRRTRVGYDRTRTFEIVHAINIFKRNGVNIYLSERAITGRDGGWSRRKERRKAAFIARALLHSSTEGDRPYPGYLYKCCGASDIEVVSPLELATPHPCRVQLAVKGQSSLFHLAVIAMKTLRLRAGQWPSGGVDSESCVVLQHRGLTEESRLDHRTPG